MKTLKLKTIFLTLVLTLAVLAALPMGYGQESTSGTDDGANVDGSDATDSDVDSQTDSATDGTADSNTEPGYDPTEPDRPPEDDLVVLVIKGTVTDAETGEPVAEARVMAFGQWEEGKALTDDTGAYQLKIQVLDWVSMWVEAEGYSTYWLDFPLNGQTEMEKDIQLKPIPPKDALVKGIVTDSETGEPVVGMGVNIFPSYDHYKDERYYEDGVEYDENGEAYYEDGSKEDVKGDTAGTSSDDNTVPPTEDDGTGDSGSSTGQYPSDDDYYKDDYYNMEYDGGYSVTDENGYYEIPLYGGGSYEVNTDFFLVYGDDRTDMEKAPVYLPFNEIIKLEKNESLEFNFALEPLPPKTSTVFGRVTDAETGNPVEGVGVSVYMNYWEDPANYKEDYEEYYDDRMWYFYDDGGYAETDADGLYKIELYAGSYSLNAYMYDRDRIQQYNSFNEVFKVAENEDLEFNIQLKPLPPVDALVKGTVINAETGNPVAGAYVSVYSLGEYREDDKTDREADSDSSWDVATDMDVAEPESGSSSGSVDGSAPGDPDELDYNSYSWGDGGYCYTNDDGEYAIKLRAGYYSISVSFYGRVYYDKEIYYGDADEGWVDEPTSDGDYTEYYPFSDTFKIVGEEKLVFDIELKPLPPLNSRVMGKVVDAETGEPVPNAYLWLSGGDYYSYFSDYSDEDGEFSMSVREGKYSLYCHVEDWYYYDDYYYDENVAYEEKYGSDGDRDGDEKEVSVDSSGQNTRRETSGDDSEVSSDAVPEPEDDVVYEDDMAVGDDDYTYDETMLIGIDGMPTGRYFEYSTRFYVGEDDTKKLLIELEPYPEETSRISGVVSDKETGKPIPYASVEATITYKGHVMYDRASTDEMGSYTLSVPAASIRLMFTAMDYWYVWEDGELADYDAEGNVDHRDGYQKDVVRYFAHEQEFVIGEGVNKVLDVALEPIPPMTSTIKGTVTDPDGDMVSGAYVRLLDFKHDLGPYQMYSGSTWTDENGEFAIKTYAGKFTLVVESWSYDKDNLWSTSVGEVTVSEGETVAKDMALKKASVNEIDLDLTIDDDWNGASGDAMLTVNFGTFDLRLMADMEYGNSDGTISESEAERLADMMGNAKDGLLVIDLTVDGYRFNPSRNAPGLEVEGLVGKTTSTSPVVFTLNVDLVSPAEIDENADDHDVDLNVNSYMGGKVSYTLIFPEDFVIGESNEVSGDFEIENHRVPMYDAVGGAKQGNMLESGEDFNEAMDDASMGTGAPQSVSSDWTLSASRNSVFGGGIDDLTPTRSIDTEDESDTGTPVSSNLLVAISAMVIIVVLGLMGVTYYRGKKTASGPGTDDALDRPKRPQRDPKEYWKKQYDRKQ